MNKFLSYFDKKYLFFYFYISFLHSQIENNPNIYEGFEN